MGFWRRLASLFGGKRQPPASAAILKTHVFAIRRMVATLEAQELWWMDREERAQLELEKWQRRLPLADSPELRTQVRGFITIGKRDLTRISAGLKRCRVTLAETEEPLIEAMAM